MHVISRHYKCSLCNQNQSTVVLNNRNTEMNKTCHDNINMSQKCREIFDYDNNYSYNDIILDFEIEYDKINGQNIVQWWQTHRIANFNNKKFWINTQKKIDKFIEIYQKTMKIKISKIGQIINIKNK